MVLLVVYKPSAILLFWSRSQLRPRIECILFTPIRRRKTEQSMYIKVSLICICDGVWNE